MSKVTNSIRLIVLSGIILGALTCSKPIDPPAILEWDRIVAWSNQGDRIAFFSFGNPDSASVPGIYIVDTTGQNRYLAVPEGARGVWLPGDTAMVLFKGDFNLYYYNLQTGTESLLCNWGSARFPTGGQDGRTIYFEAHGSDPYWATSIFRIDLQSGTTTEIIGGRTPSLSPDARFLISNQYGLVRYDLDTDSERAVFPSGQDITDIMVDWSPDGSKLLLSHFYDNKLMNKILTMNADGSGVRTLTYGSEARYSRDGKRLAVVRPGADKRYHIWLVNSDGSQPRQITY